MVIAGATHGLDARGCAFRRIVWAVTIGTAAFAGAQAVYALSVGSAQFLQDAIDWAYTVILNAVAAIVIGRGARFERLSAYVVAGVLAVAGLHALYDLWDKVAEPRPIAPALLGLSAASATVIGYLTAGALAPFRREANPLIRATWLSARNDAIVTTLGSAVTLAARLAPVRWPEYTVDVIGAGLAFQAAAATIRVAWLGGQDPDRPGPRPAAPHRVTPRR